VTTSRMTPVLASAMTPAVLAPVQVTVVLEAGAVDVQAARAVAGARKPEDAATSRQVSAD
jgi:hypothetical protein